MKLTRRETLATGAGLLGASLLPRFAHAADYPERPITVAMVAPAGGATDRGTRPVVEFMKEALGARAMSVQDMSGAGGVQGLDYVYQQPADGYTWGGMNDVIEAFPSLGRMDYDWRAFDFWMSGGTACGIAVPADSPIENFEQFVNEVMDKPGQYSVASTPSGSLWSNVAEYLRKQMGLDFKLANYGGGGPSVRAVLAGETDFGCMGLTPMVNFIRAGQMRCIVTWAQRDWEVAGQTLPTISNYIDDPLVLRTLPWTNIHGIGTKKGVPEEILQQIDAAFAEAMADPSMQQVYEENAFVPFQVGRPEANELMGQRTALQAYIIEVILGTAVKTREELDIPKLEEA
jgi:tripartite-type tricarboxylate transporter receptor subunit TctC